MIYMGLARWLMGGRRAVAGGNLPGAGRDLRQPGNSAGLDARWTAAAWAVEGAGFSGSACAATALARAFALLLQLGSALVFLSELHNSESSLLGGVPLGALMLGVALLFSFLPVARLPDRIGQWERKGLPVLACLGLAFLYLLAPLFFFTHGTAISWALAGLATLLVGLRLHIAHVPVQRVRCAIARWGCS